VGSYKQKGDYKMQQELKKIDEQYRHGVICLNEAVLKIQALGCSLEQVTKTLDMPIVELITRLALEANKMVRELNIAERKIENIKYCL